MSKTSIYIRINLTKVIGDPYIENHKTFFIYLFIYFIFGCVGSSFLCEGFL